MLNLLKSAYDKAPKKTLKFLKYIPNRVLFGNSYTDHDYQISFDKHIVKNNLLNILNYAHKNTAYGKENIPKKIYIEEVHDLLQELPLISSQDISQNLDYYTSQEFQNKKSYLTTTGGTGRNPTTILLSNESYGMEWKHMHHIWSHSNYSKKNNLNLTLRGKSLKNNKLLEYSPIYNELIVDTFKVKNENFKQFIEILKKYPITHIHGYPSLVKEFMHYFKEYDYIPPNIEGILLGSEGATIEDKKSITDFFNAKVLHWYGQTEKVTLAVDTENNNLFKVYTSYGYPREVEGELVCTSFINKALPLINYRTGDSAQIIEDDQHIYLKDLKGRWGKDFIYLNKEKKIPTSSINLHSVIQDEILFYQIKQNEYAKLHISILPKSHASAEFTNLKDNFRNEMKKSLKEFELEVEIVREQDIMRSVRGKMLMLIQNLTVI